MTLTGSGATLVGETLHFNANELLCLPKGEQADGRALPVETLATGDWSMSFKIDYKSPSACPRDRASPLTATAQS